MQIRSWTATLALVTGWAALLASQGSAQSSGSGQAPPSANRPIEQRETSKSPDPQAPARAGQSVDLTLLIAGLGQDGCDVEIKPGNRNCRFSPQTQHVGSQGKASFHFRDVELRGADHNCSFAITVREAGQTAKTIYRGFRMAPSNTAKPAAKSANAFTCYMNSPSKLAAVEKTDRTRQ
jgi:hypothetical protein